MVTGFVGRAHPYLHMDELADLLNAAAGKCVWDTRQLRRKLGPSGALMKLGDRYVTTRAKLRESFPDLWDEIVLQLDEA